MVSDLLMPPNRKAVPESGDASLLDYVQFQQVQVIFGTTVISGKRFGGAERPLRRPPGWAALWPSWVERGQLVVPWYFYYTSGIWTSPAGIASAPVSCLQRNDTASFVAPPTTSCRRTHDRSTFRPPLRLSQKLPPARTPAAALP